MFRSEEIAESNAPVAPLQMAKLSQELWNNSDRSNALVAMKSTDPAINAILGDVQLDGQTPHHTDASRSGLKSDKIPDRGTAADVNAPHRPFLNTPHEPFGETKTGDTPHEPFGGPKTGDTPHEPFGGPKTTDTPHKNPDWTAETKTRPEDHVAVIPSCPFDAPNKNKKLFLGIKGIPDEGPVDGMQPPDLCDIYKEITAIPESMKEKMPEWWYMRRVDY